jgi:hypothetical protein
MLPSMTRILWPLQLFLVALTISLAMSLAAQQPPYDVFPPAEPPYYRVRYEASTRPGELVYPVNTYRVIAVNTVGLKSKP